MALHKTNGRIWLIIVLAACVKENFVSGQCFKEEDQPTTEQPRSEDSSNYQAVFFERQLEFSLDMFHKLYNKVNLERKNYSTYEIILQYYSLWLIK